MMSEGEQYIAYFLEAEGIKFKQEYPIDKLNGDSKSHRVADFYLPRYNVYIEFFGQWQDETHKARYREKKEIYIQNRVPCVILSSIDIN